MTTILLKKKEVYPLGNFNGKELYNILTLGNYQKPTTNEDFKAFFESTTSD